MVKSKVRDAYLSYIENPNNSDLDFLVSYYSKYIEVYCRFCCAYIDGAEYEDLYQEGICKFIDILKSISSRNGNTPSYVGNILQLVRRHLVCYMVRNFNIPISNIPSTLYDGTFNGKAMLELSNVIDNNSKYNVGIIEDVNNYWEDDVLSDVCYKSICEIVDKVFSKESNADNKNYLAVKSAFYDDVTYSNYGKKLGISTSSVKTMVFKGLSSLRHFVIRKDIKNPFKE